MAKQDKQYWLMKSEPDEFGIDDLARVGVEPWTGVRNYMARAYMRAMSVGDGVLFHHSNAKPPGVAGLARVVRTGVVDEKQFDPESPYFEPRATRDKPVWDCVDVEFVGKLAHFVSLDRMRADPELAKMMVLKKGMRLSVQPVTAAEFARVVELGETAWEGEGEKAKAKGRPRATSSRVKTPAKGKPKAAPARAKTPAKGR
ncbi:MAG: EVE domain-containing protein [Kofleriaceae bacterium]